MKRLSTILIVMILLIAVPIETFAVSKPAQVKNLKASAKTAESITLKWRKAKGAKGYEVQQYDTKAKKWKALKKVNVLKYKHTKLKSNTAYKYRVRAYRSYKQYYNTKTKKWVNKKPAKKSWKTKNSRKVYVYGKASSVLTVRTKTSGAPTRNPTNNASANIIYETDTDNSILNFKVVNALNNELTFKWNSLGYTKYILYFESRTNQGNEVFEVASQTGATIRLPYGSWRLTVSAKTPKKKTLICDGFMDIAVSDRYCSGYGFYCFKNHSVDIKKTGETYTAISYNGKTTYYNLVEGGGYSIPSKEEQNSFTLYSSLMAYEDKTIDGSFGDYVQVSGATFNAKELANPKSYYYGGYMAQVYNVDPSKLDVRLGSGVSIESVSTFKWNSQSQTREPLTSKYISKKGKRIAMAYDKNDKLYKVVDYGGKQLVFSVFGDDDCGGGMGVGIYNDSFSLDVYYNNKFVGTANFTSSKDVVAETGMSKTRSKYYALAKTAINSAGGSSGTISGDYHIIADYIHANIVNGQTVSTQYGNIDMFVCNAAAAVLETWLIYNYGNAGCGFVQGSPSQSFEHRDYTLNSKPDDRLTVYFKPAS